MTKHNDLESEQLPTDGSYQMKRLLDEANRELRESGQHGRTCALKTNGSTISYQFNFGGQKNKGSGYRLNKQGILDAKRIATIVSNQLAANRFSWEWFDGLLGKRIETEKILTCHEMIVEFKAHWFKENKKLKNPDTCWYNRFKHLEQTLQERHEKLTDNIIKEAIGQTENDSHARRYTLQALNLFLDYFKLKEFNDLIAGYQNRNNPKKGKKHVPSDKEIKYIFDTGFNPDSIRQNRWKYRAKQWQFLYGLLAVYGLRVHEAWHIANWDKPVVLRKGDWVAVSFDVDTEADRIEQYQDDDRAIPAILDPSNTDKILCIKHDTKTGYRMAIPVSPLNSNWLKEFDLLSEFNLPDIKNPFKKNNTGSIGCTTTVGYWFSRHNYGFTPHALRHAYNHRCHQLEINPVVIARSLGHSLQMNQTAYLDSMSESRKLEMFKEAIEKDNAKRDRIHELEEENKVLKLENERLRTELKMYEALKQDN